MKNPGGPRRAHTEIVLEDVDQEEFTPPLNYSLLRTSHDVIWRSRSLASISESKSRPYVRAPPPRP